TVNNRKKVALEVIDQQSKILLLTDLIHPDLGAFKKSIEQSKFRKVEIKNPIKDKIDLNDYQMVILYQPNRSFDKILQEIRQFRKNTLVVIGTKTAVDYWNSVEPAYNLLDENFAEDIQGSFQSGFKTFYVKDIGFDNFPPLKGMVMEIEPKVNFEVLLTQKIRGRNIESPLFATFESAESKHAVFFVENIWRWRAQDFLNQKNFEGFDGFMGNLVQYLSSNQKRERLQLDFETIYESNDNLRIRAGYFDEIFNFDNRAALKITLQNQQTNEQFVFPFLLQSDYYEANLNGIPPGEYKFTVLVEGENLKKEGVFTVLDFDLEKQFSGADYNKLKNVSNQTDGEIFMPNKVQKLIHSLKEDSRFKPVLKEFKSDAPLIDWIWLLILMVLSLGAEWVLRKYSGLI
ncbi:MAG: VWA domain-containing protein, partial [Flavobacteriaceae bacterium]|nr:VWA domain-containing protein [Flavobacteriaceae bacterium]